MGLMIQVQRLRGAAAGDRRFHRPAGGIAQVNGVHLLARLKRDITDLKHSAHDARLLRTEQETHRSVRTRYRFHAGRCASRPPLCYRNRGLFLLGQLRVVFREILLGHVRCRASGQAEREGSTRAAPIINAICFLRMVDCLFDYTAMNGGNVVDLKAPAGDAPRSLVYPTREAVVNDVRAYIAYYNPDRLHTMLGGQTPIEFEQSA